MNVLQKMVRGVVALAGRRRAGARAELAHALERHLRVHPALVHHQRQVPGTARRACIRHYIRRVYKILFDTT